VIDRALEQRPDLIAQVASLRAKERKSVVPRAEFWPSCPSPADVGGVLARLRIQAGSCQTGWLKETEPRMGPHSPWTGPCSKGARGAASSNWRSRTRSG